MKVKSNMTLYEIPDDESNIKCILDISNLIMMKLAY